MNKILYFTIVAAFLVVACKKEKVPAPVDEKTKYALYLNPVVNDSDYLLNDVIESPQGYKYYYSDIIIVGTNVGNGANNFDADFIYDFNSTGTLMSSGSSDVTDFSNLTFNIGVPDPLNHADPSLQPNTSALNPVNIGSMHWGWNPGYKFVTIEGKADTIADGIDNFDHSFFFHLGMDVLFRTKTLTDVTWTNDNGTMKAVLKLNMNEILDGTNPTDLRVNYASHSANTQMAYSLVIMNEFVAAIKK